MAGIALWRRKYSCIRFITVAVILGSLVSALPSQSRSAHFSQTVLRNSDKLEVTLGAHASLLPRETLPVIIRFSDADLSSQRIARTTASAYEIRRSREERNQAIRDAGGTPVRGFAHIAAHSALMSGEALQRLVQDPRVIRVSEDHPIAGSLYLTAEAIGADQIWPGGSSQLGSDGRGVVLAVIDSGIEHEQDLNNTVLQSLSFVAGSSAGGDLYGHGTHIAGIIAGHGSKSAPGTGYSNPYRGIAPGSDLISLKVLDSSGSGKTSDVIEALEWCIANKDIYGIRVINLSLGHPVFESYKTDPLCQMVEACVQNGIVVVVAAGNYGRGTNGAVYGGINSPANDPAAITVGAIDTHGTAARSDDTVAGYSSRGPTAIDGLIKPDLVAPGNKIISVASDDGTLYRGYQSNRVYPASGETEEASYFVLSGTSMAAAVVSGTVALMLEANPSLTPNAVKAILAYTAERMTSPNILEQGNGYMNTEGAVRLAAAASLDFGSIPYGAQWIANPGSLQPFSTIMAERVIWGGSILWGDTVICGDGVLWGDGILWGDLLRTTSAWTDSLMVLKQPSMASSILWGDGMLLGNSLVVGNLSLWNPGIQIGTTAIRSTTSSKWLLDFVDPFSMTDPTQDILAHGEDGSVLGPQTATLGAWFLPAP